MGYREILSHYFPETTLEGIHVPAAELIAAGRGSSMIRMELARR